MNRPRTLSVLTAILLFSLPLWAQAQPVARVIMTFGPVLAIDRDDRERAISRHDPVYAGETVRTGTPRGGAQLRLRDDALINLRAHTVFNIEEYREAETDDNGGSAVMNLVRGALRKVSGRIGARAGDVYRMNTPTATIGIRGTDYSLQYCDEECVGDGRQLGVYGRVDDGDVIVENDFGRREFGRGDHFFVPEEGPPTLVLIPPAGVLDDAAEAPEEVVDSIDDSIQLAAAPADEDPLRERETGRAFEAADGLVEERTEDTRDEQADEPEDTPVIDAPSVRLPGTRPRAARDSALAYAAEGSVSDHERAEEFFTTRDANGNVTSIFGGNTVINSSGVVFKESGATEQDVNWAQWEVGGDAGGTVEINGETFESGTFIYFLTDNVTTATGDFQTTGTRRLGLSSDTPAPDELDQLDIRVDLGALEATLEKMRLRKPHFGESFLLVVFEDQRLDLDSNLLVFSTDGAEGAFSEGLITKAAGPNADGLSGEASLKLEGSLVGDAADGAIVAYRVELEHAAAELAPLFSSAFLDESGYAGSEPASGELLAGGVAGEKAPTSDTNRTPFAESGTTDRAGNVQFDEDGQPVEIQMNERVFDFSNASKQTPSSIQGVDWGIWRAGNSEGSFQLDNQIVDNGAFVWAHTDQVTTPEQFADLSGTRTMDLHPEGPPQAFTTSGSPVEIDAFRLAVNLDAQTADIRNFKLSEGFIETIFDENTFDSGALTLDPETGTLVGSNIEGTISHTGEPGGTVSADFDGFLVGEQADGSVIGFAIDRSQADFTLEDIGGAAILHEME